MAFEFADSCRVDAPPDVVAVAIRLALSGQMMVMPEGPDAYHLLAEIPLGMIGGGIEFNKIDGGTRMSLDMKMEPDPEIVMMGGGNPFDREAEGDGEGGQNGFMQGLEQAFLAATQQLLPMISEMAENIALSGFIPVTAITSRTVNLPVGELTEKLNATVRLSPGPNDSLYATTLTDSGWLTHQFSVEAISETQSRITVEAQLEIALGTPLVGQAERLGARLGPATRDNLAALVGKIAPGTPGTKPLPSSAPSGRELQ